MWHTSHVSTSFRVTSTRHITSELLASAVRTLAHSNSSKRRTPKLPYSSGVHVVPLSPTEVVTHGMSRKVPHHHWRHHPSTPLLLFYFGTSGFRGLCTSTPQFSQPSNFEVTNCHDIYGSQPLAHRSDGYDLSSTDPMVITFPPPNLRCRSFLGLWNFGLQTLFALIIHKPCQIREIRRTCILTLLHLPLDLTVVKDPSSPEQILRPNTIDVVISFSMAIS
jgi:hypothetical protein